MSVSQPPLQDQSHKRISSKQLESPSPNKRPRTSAMFPSADRPSDFNAAEYENEEFEDIDVECASADNGSSFSSDADIDSREMDTSVPIDPALLTAQHEDLTLSLTKEEHTPMPGTFETEVDYDMITHSHEHSSDTSYQEGDEITIEAETFDPSSSPPQQRSKSLFKAYSDTESNTCSYYESNYQTQAQLYSSTQSQSQTQTPSRIPITDLDSPLSPPEEDHLDNASEPDHSIQTPSGNQSLAQRHSWLTLATPLQQAKATEQKVLGPGGNWKDPWFYSLFVQFKTMAMVEAAGAWRGCRVVERFEFDFDRGDGDGHVASGAEVDTEMEEGEIFDADIVSVERGRTLRGRGSSEARDSDAFSGCCGSGGNERDHTHERDDLHDGNGDNDSRQRSRNRVSSLSPRKERGHVRSRSVDESGFRGRGMERRESGRWTSEFGADGSMV